VDDEGRRNRDGARDLQQLLGGSRYIRRLQGLKNLTIIEFYPYRAHKNVTRMLLCTAVPERARRRSQTNPTRYPTLFTKIAYPRVPSFFGTTLYGGSSAAGGSTLSGYGTVFRLGGDELTTLWNISAGDDGRSPSGALIADDVAGIPGAMYGTTRGFHAPLYGTVFRIENRADSLSTIWSFSGSDGDRPLGALLADKTGALYGMTFKGGVNFYDNVFKLTHPTTARPPGPSRLYGHSPAVTTAHTQLTV
jgi:hypothetical protein